jgi:hypothetical protein
MIWITLGIVALAGVGVAVWYFFFGPGKKIVVGGGGGNVVGGGGGDVAVGGGGEAIRRPKYTCPIIEKCEISGPPICDRGEIPVPGAWVLTRTAEGVKCSQIRHRPCDYATCYTPKFETKEECESQCIQEEVERRDSRPVLEPKKS